MKHQRKLNRLAGYDYSHSAGYFVTICTNEKISYFGKICNGKMELNDLGKIAEKFWKEIPQHYMNISLDVYAIMPNHVHGIIFITDDILKINAGTEHCSVPTVGKNKNYGLLSKVVKSYKEKVTKGVKNLFPLSDFSWQRSFYDHIIRNEQDYFKIQQYIFENLKRWQKVKKENNIPDFYAS
ncbi:MAG TPA: transposase [Ignavibacteria bacterium]|nr:transposase [Ignavibacteria bacterium]